MRPGLTATETSVDARNAEEKDAPKDTDTSRSGPVMQEKSYSGIASKSE